MDKKIIFLLITLLSLSFVSANSSYLNVHVRPLIGGVYQPSTSFNYEFNFSNNDDCSNTILSITKTIITDNYGIGYSSLNITSLNNTPNYLCEYRNGIIRKVHTIGSELFHDVHISNDLKIGGNVTADHFIGDGSLLTGISTITSVNTNGNYLIGGGITGDINLLINESMLNNTIDDRSSGGVSDGFWNIIGSNYLINDTNILKINESLLNLTIDSRDDDTTYSLLSEFVNDVGYVTNISVNKSQDCSLITGSVSNLCTLTDTDTNTQIGNCSITGSCSNIAYMDYSNNNNFNITGNITADYFIGDGSLLTGISSSGGSGSGDRIDDSNSDSSITFYYGSIKMRLGD